MAQHALPVHSSKRPKESGVMLDIARYFYTAETIKGFIDVIAASGGTFLHLHASDTENYALESALLGQTVAHAVVHGDGSYSNPATGKKFLSNAQIAEIVRYAQGKGVEVIPEVDAPSHIKGIYDLLVLKEGSAHANALFDAVYEPNNPQLYYSKPESVAFIKALYSEVATAFKGGGSHFHIGGDEFHGPHSDSPLYVAYVNEMADFLATRGLRPRMWNDGALKSTYDKLNRAIEITYWSRKDEHRATLPELANANFTVLNYNHHYLYNLPKERFDGTSADNNFDARLVLSDWNLGLWDGKNSANQINDTSKIAGAAIAIWGEEAGNLPNATVLAMTANHIDAVIKKTNAAADSALAAQIAQQVTNDYAGLDQNFYVDLAHAQNGLFVELSGSGKQDLILLNEHADGHTDRVITIAGGLQRGVDESRRDEVFLGNHWAQGADDGNYQTYHYKSTILRIENDVKIKRISEQEVDKEFSGSNILNVKKEGDSMSTNSAANAVSLASVNYGIKTHAVYGKYIDARDFGVDTTGRTDSLAAINKALAAAHKEKVAVYLSGDIYISNQIVLNKENSGVTGLFGDGMGKTTISFDRWQGEGAFNSNTNLDDVRSYAAILIDGQSRKTVADFSLKYTNDDFYRKGDSYFGKVNGILVNDANNTLISKVEVSGFNRAGVHFTSSKTLEEDPSGKLNKEGKKKSYRQGLIDGDIDENYQALPLGKDNHVVDSNLHHNRVAGILFGYQKNFIADNNVLAWNGHEADGGTGYGVAAMAGSYNFGIAYTNNTTDHNYRKGLDIHDGNDIVIKNNKSIGDRLYGIAVYNRAFLMDKVKIIGNTVTQDASFRLAGVDDGDVHAGSGLKYHGYTGIELQTNTQFQNFKNSDTGAFEIKGNTITGVDQYENSKDTYGVNFRNHEPSMYYTLDISGNTIEGLGASSAIAIINETERVAGVAGQGSGNIDVSRNKINFRNANYSPIYIEEKGNFASLRGTVKVDGNHVTIAEARKSSDGQGVGLRGNAENYVVTNNIWNLSNGRDAPLVSFAGWAAEKSTLTVSGNSMTSDKLVDANYYGISLRNGALEPFLSVTKNTNNGKLIAEKITVPNSAASITVSGKAEVGQTLTATVTDGNGVPAKVQYQWLAGGTAITGANAASYTLKAADAGKAIAVRASFTDNAGYAETATSAATAAVVNKTPPADKVAPELLSVKADNNSLQEGQSTRLTFTFSEAVKDFIANDIVVSNGSIGNFAKVNDKTYTATYHAAKAGKGTVSVAAGVFTDMAGNRSTKGVKQELTITVIPTPKSGTRALTDKTAGGNTSATPVVPNTPVETPTQPVVPPIQGNNGTTGGGNTSATPVVPNTPVETPTQPAVPPIQGNNGTAGGGNTSATPVVPGTPADVPAQPGVLPNRRQPSSERTGFLFAHTVHGTGAHTLAIPAASNGSQQSTEQTPGVAATPHGTNPASIPSALIGSISGQRAAARRGFLFAHTVHGVSSNTSAANSGQQLAEQGLQQQAGLTGRTPNSSTSSASGQRLWFRKAGYDRGLSAITGAGAVAYAEQLRRGGSLSGQAVPVRSQEDAASGSETGNIMALVSAMAMFAPAASAQTALTETEHKQVLTAVITSTK